MRILLVEDDSQIAEAVRSGLKAAGHAVDVFADGQSALAAPGYAGYDCVLLDLGLPGIPGDELLKRWRTQGLSVPVIILTARDGVDARVRGLDAGADDYMVKPFSMEELKARLRAVTRRRGAPEASVLTNGTVCMDPAAHQVWIEPCPKTETGASVQTDQPSERREVMLTAREFAVLEALLRRPGAVLSREQIEGQVYSFDDEVDSNAVEFIIHNLRRKIGADQIKNVRGVGWKVVKTAPAG